MMNAFNVTVRTAVLMLALLSSPLIQAGGGRSPEAVAQAFAGAYRSGNVEAILALELFTDGAGGTAAEVREREARAWRQQMVQWRLRGYRVAALLGRDRPQWQGGAQPVKRLEVEYLGAEGGLQGRYLIVQQDGYYYLLSVHDGQ